MGDLRDTLVAVAADLLDAGGPAAVTLREVGARAGVSRTAPYLHFDGKEALLAAVADRELRRRLMVDGLSSRPPSTQSQIMAYARWALRHPARFRLVSAAWRSQSAGLAEAIGEARERLEAAVADDQTAARLPPGNPARLAALVLAVAHGAADLALAGQLGRQGKGGSSPEDLVADLFGYLGAAAGEAAGAGQPGEGT